MTVGVSLAEEITEVIRQRIINGGYAMGEKLVENRIATELKVSRTPVRDAFKQLAKEQLVEYIPNKGCFARGFSHKDMTDIYAVRKAVGTAGYDMGGGERRRRRTGGTQDAAGNDGILYGEQFLRQAAGSQ